MKGMAVATQLRRRAPLGAHASTKKRLLPCAWNVLIELDEQVIALYQRYIHGQMTFAEVGSAIDGLNGRDFGPVSLSRHKRPQESARSH
jgi:hypothetical protein